MKILQFSVPKVGTEPGKMGSRFLSPRAWNNLQTDLKLQNVVTLEEFRAVVKSLQSSARVFYEQVFM